MPGEVEYVSLVRRRFSFDFDWRLSFWLPALGVVPSTSFVELNGDRFEARFGPWVVRTPLANLSCAKVTERYRWYTAIGVRGSMVDDGLTFGTNRRKGVCVLFRERVKGLDPFGLRMHSGLTVTVDDCEGLERAVKDVAASLDE